MVEPLGPDYHPHHMPGIVNKKQKCEPGDGDWWGDDREDADGGAAEDYDGEKASGHCQAGMDTTHVCAYCFALVRCTFVDNHGCLVALEADQPCDAEGWEIDDHLA